MNVQFLNEEHKKRFEQMYNLLERSEEIDFSKTAYLFLITGDSELQEKTAHFAFLRDQRIFHSEQLAREQLTRGSKLLAVLGSRFLKKEQAVLSLHERSCLSDEQLKLALNAIVIRRTGLNQLASIKRFYHFA